MRQHVTAILKSSIAVLSATALFACSTPSEGEDKTAALLEPAPIALDDWATEVIPFPPGFAPQMPTGVESLLFAPQWRVPDHENFWSYTLAMWIDEPAPNADRITELLDQYYDGLMSLVASGKGADIGSDPAQVEVVQTATNLFEAKLRFIDAFVTLGPVDLRVLIETAAVTAESSSLRIQVSPQPAEHAIWKSLNAAVTSIDRPR